MKQVAIGIVIGFVLATSGVQGVAKLADNLVLVAKDKVTKATE